MGVDQAGGDPLAAGVHDLKALRRLKALADRDDLAAPDDDRGVLQRLSGPRVGAGVDDGEVRRG